MKAGVFHGAFDIRVDEVPDPGIEQPTDALVRVTHACICGSDLWFYRGKTPWKEGYRTGHEFCGIVDAVGDDVKHVKPGDMVIAPFAFSDGTCEFCRKGLHTSCVQGGGWAGPQYDGGQGEAVRVPLADGTLVVVPPEAAGDAAVMRRVAPLTDVLPTGHHAVVSAGVVAGSTVAVVGDGAVGLCAVLASKRLGAERIIAVGHHPERLELARRFGATDIVDSSSDGAEQVRELTQGGAECVAEAVGAQSSMDLAIAAARPGGIVGFVGVPLGIEALNVRGLFNSNVALRGGVAPVRAYLDDLLPDVLNGKVDPSPIFDQTLTLDQLPDGYKAMHERSAIKALVTVA